MTKHGRRRWNLNIHYHRVALDALPPDATAALDVGSGDGLLSFELAARGLDVTGIDPDAACIERARADRACSDRTTFVHGDVFTHPFEPASFDLVAASAMLHHVDARDGLRRMAELVRPGGSVAIVGFANPSSLADRALVAAGFALTRTRAFVGRYWEHHAPICWPPPHTMDEMRAMTATELPGASFGRGMAQRYWLVWRRPTLPGPPPTDPEEKHGGRSPNRSDEDDRGSDR